MNVHTKPPVAPPVELPPQPAMNPRTRALLQGPIVPTLFRLAWPNVLIMFAQAATGLIETFWVGMLGTDALAGGAGFPGVMLMQMFPPAPWAAASPPRSRARRRRPTRPGRALVHHALAINGVGLASWRRCPVRPAALPRDGRGGRPPRAALIYSNIVFGGIAALWLMNALASVICGTDAYWCPRWRSAPASSLVPLAAADLRPRPDPRDGDRRRRHRARALQSRRRAGARLVCSRAATSAPAACAAL